MGGITPSRIGAAIGIGGGISLLLVSISLFWRRRPQQRHPVQRLLTRFSNTLVKKGLGKQPDETPQRYILRLAAIARVDQADLAEDVQRALYDPDVSMNYFDLYKLHRRLNKLRFRLAFTGRPVAS